MKVVEQLEERPPVLEENINNATKANLQQYSNATFIRAFPDYRDGLKPVVRRIIWTMHDNNIYNFKKVASVSGRVLLVHPHGDASVNDALVRLGQSWSLNYPLIDGQGNFGSQSGDPSAASRYIESKLSQFAKKVIFDDLDEVSVDWEWNYDYTIKMPSYLPSRIPLVLINGVEGIGEAFRCNIPPHNLVDIADRCVQFIRNKNILNEVLCDGLYPDFPTGGTIVNGAELEEFYKDGRPCTIVVRGKANLDTTKNIISMTEFPFGVNCDDITLAVDQARKNGNMILSGIDDIQDDNHIEDSDTKINSEKKKKKKTYEYTCKKDANMVEILNEIYKITKFQNSITLSFMTSQNGFPKYVTVKDIIRDWYVTRVDTLRRKYTNIIANAQYKRHVYEGLLFVYDKIDDVIKVIRANTDGKEELIEKLHKMFGLTKTQARGIYEMNLGSLSKFGKSDLEEKIARGKEIVETNDKNLTRIDEIIIEQLEELKQLFGRPRRTNIVMQQEEIKNKKVVVTKGAMLYSHNAIGLYDANGICNSKSILNGLKPFVENGKKVREVCGGFSLVGSPEGFIVFSAKGGAFRIDPSVFKISNVWYNIGDDGSEYTCACPIYSDEDVVICVSTDGKIKGFKASDVTGKREVNSGGTICACCTVPANMGYSDLVIACDDGSYNAFAIDDIPVLGRASSGVKFTYSEAMQHKLFLLPIKEEIDDPSYRIMISSIDSSDGQSYVISIPVNELKLTNRNAKAKSLSLPKTHNVTCIQDMSVADKNNTVCFIGKSSSSTLSVTNFRKPFSDKKLYLTVVGQVLI